MFGGVARRELHTSARERRRKSAAAMDKLSSVDWRGMVKTATQKARPQQDVERERGPALLLRAMMRRGVDRGAIDGPCRHCLGLQAW